MKSTAMRVEVELSVVVEARCRKIGKWPRDPIAYTKENDNNGKFDACNEKHEPPNGPANGNYPKKAEAPANPWKTTPNSHKKSN